MGREIRRVPPNWEHPTKTAIDYKTGKPIEVYVPLFEDDIEKAFSHWLEKYKQFLESGIEEVLKEEENPDYWRSRPYRLFCDWYGDPPVVREHVDYEGVEPTWYQVYENVSEGTPITPPFASKEDLIEHLCSQGWSRDAAKNFVEGNRFLPSGIVVDGKIIDQTQEVI